MPVFGPETLIARAGELDRPLRRVPREAPTTRAACRWAGSGRSPRASGRGPAASGAAGARAPLDRAAASARSHASTRPMTPPGQRRRATSEARPHRARVGAHGAGVDRRWPVVVLAGGQPQLEGAPGAGARRARRRVRRVGQVLHAPQGRRRGAPAARVERGGDRGVREDFERGEDIARPRGLPRCGCSARRRRRALGVARVFPIRSLGPRPGKSASSTPWRRGSRVVDEEGEPVARGHRRRRRRHRLPEGHIGGRRRADAPDPARPGGRRDPARAGRTGARTGYVAYSKLCTHVGLPGRAVPGRVQAAAVPVPPVDLRRARRRPAGLRPGGPLAPPAPARGRRRGHPGRPAATSPSPSGPASGTADR